MSAVRLCRVHGWVAEWFKAAVLKTANPQGFVGSNPTPSASHRQHLLSSLELFLDTAEGIVTLVTAVTC